MYKFIPQTPLAIATAPPPDPDTEYRRGDFLTALYVCMVTAAVLWPGLNTQLQKSVGVLVRGDGTVATQQPDENKLGSGDRSIPFKPSNPTDPELGKKVIRAMKAKGYRVDGDMNIVYLRDFHCQKFDTWCDVQLVLGGDGRILYSGRATTRPGAIYYQRPASSGGVFEIASGQYQSWRVGQHCGLLGSRCHEGLIQVGSVSGTRALKSDRSDAKPSSGLFGINLHGSSSPTETVGLYSAGCLVSDTMAAHQEFMSLIKQFKKGTYTVTILDWKGCSGSSCREVRSKST